MILAIGAWTIAAESYLEYRAHALNTRSQPFPIKVDATDLVPDVSLHQML